MKLRVQRKDGAIETLTIVPPISRVFLGGQLNYLRDATGMEHWFDLEGYYDGWGMACSIPLSEGPNKFEGAEQAIQNIEESREVEG